MARPREAWDEVRALFERGVPLSEIAEKTCIKDKGSISKKARVEGWEKGKRQPTVVKEVQAKQALMEVEEEKATFGRDDLKPFL
jgi:hypothetical protein